jgi:AraC-like DNA-binding protein
MGFNLLHYSQASESDRQRSDRVCRFVHERLGQPICLAEAVYASHLNTAAPSRFFRKHLRRTFPEFINELRVGRACRLLAETESTTTGRAGGMKKAPKRSRRGGRFFL